MGQDDAPAHSPTVISAWPCGLLRTRLDGTILLCNEHFARLAGQPLDSLVGQKRFSDLLNLPGKLFYETHFLPQLRLQSRVSELAFDLLGAGGTRVPVLLNAEICRGSGGEPDEICFAVFQAVERRRYEQELLSARRSAEQLNEVFRYSDDAILSMLPDDCVNTWNESAVRLFGYPPREAIGRSIYDLIVPADKRKEFAAARQRLTRGERIRMETVFASQSGGRIDVSLSLTPHLEPPGIMVAYSAVIRDETERKRTFDALLRSEKIASVGRLASSIAHEINNPLEAVTNLLYLVEGASELSPQTRQFIATAQEEINRVNHIATHTLRFHRQSTRPGATDLGVLLDSVLALYTARLRNVQVLVDRRYGSTGPLVAYESELRQVFANLLGNAIDAMADAPQRRLSLRVRPSHHGVWVTIADSGCGLNPTLRQRLFEPFFSTKGINGTGLGLWVSKEILDRHRARISVRTREGAGTVFRIFLPFLSQAADQPA